MSAQIDTTIDSLIASNHSKSKAKINDGSDISNVFASLIQGQVPSNISFSRVDTQLSLPQKSFTPDFNEPLDIEANNLDAPEDDIHEPAANDHEENNEVENDDHREPANHVDNNKELGHENDPASMLLATQPGPSATSVASQSTTAQTASPQAGGQPQANAEVNNVLANPAVQTKQPAAQTATSASTAKVASNANGQLNIEAMDAPESTNIPANAPSKQSGKGQNNVLANITSKPETLTSQPTNALAASNVVAAQAAKDAPSTGDAKIPNSTNLLATDAEGTVNNAFTKGQNNNSNSNGQQNAAQNAGQKNGAEIAQSHANGNALQNSNFNSALNAAPAAPVAPTTQQAPIAPRIAPVSVEPLGGVAGSTTQNIAAQSRTTATPTPQARPNVPAQIITEQVAINIQRAVGAGNDRINIQLRPQELGRIDVAMEMGKDGRMTAIITAEKPETLDMLRSDSKSLLQSLNDAGLQTNSDSLSFNLKSNGGDTSQSADGNSKKSSEDDKEFSLNEEDQSDANDTAFLAEGETAQLDDDGRLDVKV